MVGVGATTGNYSNKCPVNASRFGFNARNNNSNNDLLRNQLNRMSPMMNPLLPQPTSFHVFDESNYSPPSPPPPSVKAPKIPDVQVPKQNPKKKINWGCVQVRQQINVSKKSLIEMVPLLPKTAPPYLLLESIICEIVNLFETDSNKSRELFLNVCHVLEECGFLGSSYKLESTRQIHYVFGKQMMKLVSDLKIHGLKGFKGCKTSAGNDIVPVIQTDHRLLSLDQNAFIEDSRYEKNFQDKRLIERGGFGEVYRARHSLDRMEYAVKVITFMVKTVQDYIKILREVQLYANLPSHPHVVTYKTAWLEADRVNPFGLQITEIEEESTAKIDISSSDSSSSICFEGSSGLKPQIPGVKITKVSEILEVKVEDEQETEEGDHKFNIRIREGRKRSESITDSVIDYGVVRKVNDYHGNDVMNETKITKNSCRGRFQINLYIQMELCGCNLKTWIRKRNQKFFKDAKNASKGRSSSSSRKILEKNEVNECLGIFRQILKGVSFLHSHHLIHRDLKPQNIFFNLSEDRVKIGDFGLATLHNDDVRVHSPVRPDPTTNFSGDGHTIGMGTTLYVAPEQKDSTHYDVKADVYSLGIILLELLHPFNTVMEKEKCVNQLKSQRKLPETFVSSFPEVSQMIVSLTALNPFERPSASTILSSSIFPSKDQRINSLEQEVSRLQEENTQLQGENNRLKQMLEEAGLSF